MCEESYNHLNKCCTKLFKLYWEQSIISVHSNVCKNIQTDNKNNLELESLGLNRCKTNLMYVKHHLEIWFTSNSYIVYVKNIGLGSIDVESFECINSRNVHFMFKHWHSNICVIVWTWHTFQQSLSVSLGLNQMPYRLNYKCKLFEWLLYIWMYQ